MITKIKVVKRLNPKISIEKRFSISVMKQKSFINRGYYSIVSFDENENYILRLARTTGKYIYSNWVKLSQALRIVIKYFKLSPLKNDF